MFKRLKPGFWARAWRNRWYLLRFVTAVTICLPFVAMEAILTYTAEWSNRIYDAWDNFLRRLGVTTALGEWVGKPVEDPSAVADKVPHV